MVVNFKLATGIKKFEMQKAMPAMSIEIINKGLINRNREMPADLMATNSKLSPKLPKVMMDEIKIANGSASGIAVTVT
jgi:hypothetical protein